LDKIKRQIPAEHSIYADFKPEPVDEYRRDWLTNALYAKDARVDLSSVVRHAFVEAWVRTDSRPKVDEALWARLKASAANSTASELDGSEQVETILELNRRIEREGSRARCFARARKAYSAGSYGLARRIIYSGLRENLSSLLDRQWLKLLVKTHLSPKCLTGLKRLIPVKV
jgi:hypothetical protein